ncbi:hypothetical protein POJ06DRAFT_238937 [Lipomyces tetrasporus]|uniref:Uncharacterized protein n=1 Tax=Lipomyces tetrasporus TaxID=54092 RepID=A0AAD7VRC0_9ASCO|nr:uncharacterized protein POJ06DRAFT_238937 [Lipomyces tetrasporus]KAJ8099023.1 hypothetical protein POJ06DRAFT_238937 [Lipomyces tetrasporus]
MKVNGLLRLDLWLMKGPPTQLEQVQDAAICSTVPNNYRRPLLFYTYRNKMEEMYLKLPGKHLYIVTPEGSSTSSRVRPGLRLGTSDMFLRPSIHFQVIGSSCLPKVPRLDSESTIDGSVDNVARTDALPEESASQVLEDTSVAGSTSDT